jgi:hypothetical protein
MASVHAVLHIAMGTQGTRPLQWLALTACQRAPVLRSCSAITAMHRKAAQMTDTLRRKRAHVPL